MKKNSLVKNASILMIATMVSRIIGLLYRRPLGEILGSVGLGYYGYASNLYAILLLVSSYSIPMAVSKILSEKLAKNEYRSAEKYFKGALIYGLIAGGIAGLLALFGGRILLPASQQNANLALQVLAPTIVLSAVLGVLRGYFQARHTMVPTSVSQIAEQVMNAIVSILAAWLLITGFAGADSTKTAVLGAAGGTIGTGAGVLTGLIFMLVVFVRSRRETKELIAQDKASETVTYVRAFRDIFLMLTPIILTTFINNAGMYLDGYLYAAISQFQGVDPDTVSAAYGEFSNYYSPVINIPLALASASASAMMPEVSACYTLKDSKGANASILQTLQLTMFLCIPATVGLMIFAAPIMELLFPAASSLAASLLLTGSFFVVFAALSTVTSCALQSIGKQRLAMTNAGISLGANLVFLALALVIFPGLGIYAVMLANVFFMVLDSVLNTFALKKDLGLKNEYRKTYILPVLASAIMGAAAYGVYAGITKLSGYPSAALVVAIVFAVLFYLILYVKLTGTTPEELKEFPMGTRLVKLLRKMRIYR